MRDLMRRLRGEEHGSALIVSLLATVIMLGLGLALLAIVDTQASESGKERTRDRGFNLTESVLTNQAFVMGRNWPTVGPSGTCRNDNSSTDTLGTTGTPPTNEVARLRSTLNQLYTDPAYGGATWKIKVCDDGDGNLTTVGSKVWNNARLDDATFDSNKNNHVWVRAEAVVGGTKRVLMGMVQVRTKPALPSRFGLVTGGTVEDLGTTVNTIANDALGGVLSGLLGTTPTVAKDLDPAKEEVSGFTGLRCGLTDLKLDDGVSTCVGGTVAALTSIPAIKALLSPKTEQFPAPTAAATLSIGQLRARAKSDGTYTALSSGVSDPLSASMPSCTLTHAGAVADAEEVLFVEKVGTGNQWCKVDVPRTGLTYRALVIGSGNIILRGEAITGSAPVTTTSRTFTGVVYALNLQRHPEAEGGVAGLGDSAREIIRIERGAHVSGGVYADGRGAKVGIYPPNLTALDNSLLKQAVCNPLPLVQRLLCFTLGTTDDLLNTLGLGVLGNLVSGILQQLNPQRALYGSAITSNVNVVEGLTVYGASGVVPGSFKDLGGGQGS